MRTYRRLFTRIAISLLLLARAGWSWAGEIDQLQNRQDVERFVKKINKDFGKRPIFSGAIEDTGTQTNQFFKLDMDGNGLTDLIIKGASLIVIMDLGGHYAFCDLGELGSDYRGIEGLEAIDSTGQPRKLILRLRSGVDWRSLTPPEFYLDTLVAHGGGMMEYNPQPYPDFKFQGIKISTTRCFGICPVFEMRINPNKKAWYHAIQFNPEAGEFEGELPAKEFDQLMALLRYLPLEKLKPNYTVNWTDDQTIRVEIRYNGQVRRITDYGERGTYGLQRLYSFFFGWKNSIEWTLVQED
jgi:hypothetical protein